MNKDERNFMLELGLITFLPWAILFLRFDLPKIQKERQEIKEKQAKQDKKTKEYYNNLQVLKYSGDTLELVFQDNKTKVQFQKEWRRYNDHKSIKDAPISENMRVLDFHGDTIQVKFDNAKFQRQFEKQWRKYRDYKLTQTNKNTKKR